MVQEKIHSGGSNGSSAAGHEGLDPFTRGFVRKAARRLAGRFGFQRQDREEIEQRLYLKLARHLHRGDPSDPKWKALVAITVRRHVVSMARDGEAEKRDHRRVCSLNVRIGTPDGPMELADTVGEHEIPSRRGRVKRSDQELAELRLDVIACLADVGDERQREFCERLKHDSISQVARDMGIPRTTLGTWLARLRGRFEERGLRDYL
jgi:DNA-directed RNA polymerase specialized sigma24 family protein